MASWDIKEALRAMEQGIIQNVKDGIANYGIPVDEGDVTAVVHKLIEYLDDGNIDITSDWFKAVDDAVQEVCMPLGSSPLRHPTPEKKQCAHEWLHYQGLMNSFYYCKICDVKQ